MCPVFMYTRSNFGFILSLFQPTIFLSMAMLPLLDEITRNNTKICSESVMFRQFILNDSSKWYEIISHRKDLIK